jgi:hypothetical protein
MSFSCFYELVIYAKLPQVSEKDKEKPVLFPFNDFKTVVSAGTHKNF